MTTCHISPLSRNEGTPDAIYGGMDPLALRSPQFPYAKHWGGTLVGGANRIGYCGCESPFKFASSVPCIVHSIGLRHAFWGQYGSALGLEQGAIVSQADVRKTGSAIERRERVGLCARRKAIARRIEG